jgi:Rha family phage regulatory protein
VVNTNNTNQGQYKVKKIENIEDFNELNFEPVEYSDKKGEHRPIYEMMRDGFMMLAIGFNVSQNEYGHY